MKFNHKFNLNYQIIIIFNHIELSYYFRMICVCMIIKSSIGLFNLIKLTNILYLFFVLTLEYMIQNNQLRNMKH